jgi:hypothetical protein
MIAAASRRGTGLDGEKRSQASEPLSELAVGLKVGQRHGRCGRNACVTEQFDPLVPPSLCSLIKPVVEVIHRFEGTDLVGQRAGLGPDFV